MNRVLIFMNVLLIVVCIVLGGCIGWMLGMLLGLGALSIPGVGPMIAAGSLATMLGTASVGAITGALLGGLISLLLLIPFNKRRLLSHEQR